jgi:hypothetical protein
MGPIPHLGQQSLLDQAMPPNLLNYWKADFINGLSEGVIKAAIDAYERAGGVYVNELGEDEEDEGDGRVRLATVTTTSGLRG